MLGVLLIMALNFGSQAEPCICYNSYDSTNDVCNQCSYTTYSIFNYCFDDCPTGFTIGPNSSCIQSYQSLKLINTKFSNFLTLNQSSLEEFAYDTYYSSDISHPKPTRDRGFYFESTNLLLSKLTYVLAPRFTLKIFFKPMDLGDIVALSDMIIFLDTNVVRIVIPFRYRNIYCENDLTVAEENLEINQWINAVLIVSQKTPTIIEANFNINGYSNAAHTIIGEMRSINPSNIILGGLSGWAVKGFYYQVEFWNDADDVALVVPILNDCPFLTFWDGQCTNCSDTCGSINCVRLDDCNTCYSSNCSQCTGYGIDNCLACDNTETAPWCCDLSCDSCINLGECLRCIPGYSLTFGICVPEIPTGFSSSEVLPYNVLSVSFKDNTWSQYYQDFISNDGFPVKVRNRGLYFNGMTNLIYSSNFVLSVKFSIRILMKTTAVRSPIISFPGFLSFYTMGNTINITLTDYQGVITANLFYDVLPLETWYYLTLSCSVSHSKSVIKLYENSILIITYNPSGHLRMNGVQFYLGSDKTSNYEGFLNSLDIFIGEFDPTASQSFLPCTNSLYFGCIEDCDYLSYFENGACATCSNSCSENCVRGSDCNQCNDPKCKVCDSFLDVPCIECNTGFELVDGKCNCAAGYFEQNLACLSCDSSCSACTGSGRMSCILCSSSLQKVYNGNCVYQCPNPSGYNLTHCIDYGYKAVDLRLNQMNSFSVYNYFDIGNDNTNYDINDPLMQDSRGIYFKPSSYMKKSLALAYQFSLSFWAKVELAGYLCKKSTFSIEFLATEQIKIHILLSGSAFLTYSSFAFGAWLNMNLQIEYLETMATKLTCYLFNSVQTTQTFPASLFFEDYSDVFFIGQADDSVNIFPGFQGFLWSFSISLGIDHVFDDLIACTCSLSQNNCPVEGSCFSPSSFHYASNDPASECDEKCITCSQPAICLYCYPDFINNNGICECAGGLTWNQVSKICEMTGCEFSDCYPTCLTCDGCLTRSCTSCADGYYLLYGTCVRCPTGFNQDSDGCSLNYSLVVDLKFWNHFEKMNNSLIDDQVSNYYPEIRYLRGAYFDGDSFVKVDNLVLCPDFAVEIWFFPHLTEGSLFSYQNIESLQSIYSIFIYESNLILDVTVSDMTQQSLNFSQVDHSSWNLFTFSMKYISKGNFLVNFSFNQITFNFPSTEYIFFDGSSSIQSIIGAKLSEGLTYDNFYKGFIYQLLIFNAPLISIIETNCPETCQICINKKTCLSTCYMNFSRINGECQDCKENESCLICGDFLCEECLNIFECEVCKKNSMLKNGKCQCDDGFFMNNSFECEKCEKGCKACDENQCSECVEGFYMNDVCFACGNYCKKCNENECLECETGFYIEKKDCFNDCDEKCLVCDKGKCKGCIENSFLIENKCKCLQGFEGSNCIQKELYVNISVSYKNDIILLFSEEIDSNLEKCISLKIQNNSLQLKIYPWSQIKFKISPNFEETLNNGTLLTLNFLCEIISINNSKLLKKTYVLSLHSLEIQSENQIFIETKKTYETLAVSTVSAAVAVSIFNPNFASLWSFLSCMQLLSFIYLFNIRLSHKSKGLFIGLKKYLFFPNFFEFFGVSSGNFHHFSRAAELGFKTNSIFLNTGRIISLFVIGLSLYFIGKISDFLLKICLKNRCQKLFDDFFKNYRYGFFLRFWIQNFLEIGVACGITFFSVDLTELEQAYGFFFASFLTFFMFLTIPILFLSSLMFKEKIRESSKQTMSLYGSLFYEFKDDEGGIRGNFYTFYFLRRLVMILSIFLLSSSPVIQLCLFGVFTLAVFFICLVTKPFNENALNISNAITELIIGLITIFLLWALGDDDEKLIESLDIVFVVCVNMIVAVQASSSFYIFGKTVRLMILQRKRSKVDNSNEKNLKIVVHENEVNLEQEIFNTPNVSYLSVDESHLSQVDCSNRSDQNLKNK